MIRHHPRRARPGSGASGTSGSAGFGVRPQALEAACGQAQRTGDRDELVGFRLRPASTTRNAKATHLAAIIVSTAHSH
jgi:hypothetical protein